MIDRYWQIFAESQSPFMIPGGIKICRVCGTDWEDPGNDNLCACWQMETFMHFENGEGWVVTNESDAHVYHMRFGA